MEKKPAHYIDNKEFYAKISEYKELCNEAEAAGDERPPVTQYLGECFIKIANHLAYRSNFINYTFREEMVLDGIENCLTYIHNFDPDKSKNPFAYFTQITYYAFLRRIQKEKKHQDTKMKYLQSVDLEAILEDLNEGEQGSNEFVAWMREQLDNNAREAAKMEDYKKPPKRRPKYFDEKKSSEELDI
jgi:DNA-directed RNA polymerase specialized sigma24 family protein